MNKISRNFSRVSFAVASFVVAAAAKADVDISAAVTSSTTDIKTAGGLIIGVVVAIAAFAWIRKLIK